MNKTLRILALVATLLSLPALADASDQKTFTVTVVGAESVTFDTGSASLRATYNPAVPTYDPDVPNSTSPNCSVADKSCAWYPTIIYSTNYTTNRQLVATASVTVPTGVGSILSVELAKQGPPYDNPFAPTWGPGGSQPGVWGDDFSGSTVTLASDTAKQIVKNIQNGFYAIAPILKLKFSSAPPPGDYSATVTFTIMAQ